MQIEWVKKVPKIRDETKLNPTLEHVMELIQEQLRRMNDPQYGHILTAKRKPFDNKNSKYNDPNASKGKISKSPPSNQISTLVTNFEASNPCPCCKGNHLLINCNSFAKKTPEERWEIVKVSKLCHLCLTPGHMKAQCKSTTICGCNASYKHHRLLHRRISPPRDNPKSHSQNYDHSSRKPTEKEHQKKSENQQETPKAESEAETPVSPKLKPVDSRECCLMRPLPKERKIMYFCTLCQLRY